MIIRATGAINAQDIYDRFDLPADWEGLGMPEEWLDAGDPLALVLQAVAESPTVSDAQVSDIGARLVRLLRGYNEGTVTVVW